MDFLSYIMGKKHGAEKCGGGSSKNAKVCVYKEGDSEIFEIEDGLTFALISDEVPERSELTGCILGSLYSNLYSQVYDTRMFSTDETTGWVDGENGTLVYFVFGKPIIIVSDGSDASGLKGIMVSVEKMQGHKLLSAFLIYGME